MTLLPGGSVASLEVCCGRTTHSPDVASMGRKGSAEGRLDMARDPKSLAHVGDHLCDLRIGRVRHPRKEVVLGLVVEPA